MAPCSLRGPPFSLSRFRNYPDCHSADAIHKSESLFCRWLTTSSKVLPSCRIASEPQQKTYQVKPIPLRHSRKRHIAMPVTMSQKQRRYQKQTQSFNHGSKSMIPKTLQGSAAIIPLGSALSLHLSIHNSVPLQVYAMLSIASFCLYGFDKYRATNSGWRLRENMLHLFDLLGGWPGGYLAQRFFHHKTSKRSFQMIFWATALVHNLAWIWLFIA